MPPNQPQSGDNSLTLLVLVAAALMFIDASNFTAAMLFVLAAGATSILYFAAVWRGIFRELPHGCVWFCFSEFIHPNFLRKLYATSMEARPLIAAEHTD